MALKNECKTSALMTPSRAKTVFSAKQYLKYAAS
jgi:hypothetical protein